MLYTIIHILLLYYYILYIILFLLYLILYYTLPSSFLFPSSSSHPIHSSRSLFPSFSFPEYLSALGYPYLYTLLLLLFLNRIYLPFPPVLLPPLLIYLLPSFPSPLVFSSSVLFSSSSPQSISPPLPSLSSPQSSPPFLPSSSLPLPTILYVSRVSYSYLYRFSF